MALRPKKRYVLFEARSVEPLSRGKMTHALNVLSRKLGLKDGEGPWLLVFEPMGQDTYRGIFRVPHLSKDLVLSAMEAPDALGSIGVATLRTSGTLKKVKGLL